MKKITFLLFILFAWTNYANKTIELIENKGNITSLQTIETETGKTYRGANVQDCETCSNSKHVGNIGGPSTESGYLVSTVTVEKGGLYKMNLSYISGDPRAIFISANGQTPIESTVNSGSWTVVATKEFEIQLNVGTNSIKFYNYNSYGPNVDKFTLELLTETPACTNCLGPFEAESGTVVAPATIQDCDTCSNAKQVGDMGYSDRYFTQVVTIPTSGTYRVHVSFSSGSTRSLSITANETTTVSGDCNSVDWGVVFVKTFDIILQAGSTTLKFHNPGDWAPNIDKFSLEYIGSLNVNKNLAKSFTVFPNPTRDKWNFYSEKTLLKSIEIYDVFGKKLSAQSSIAKEASVDASNLKTGMYIAKVSSSEGEQTLKVIKE